MADNVVVTAGSGTTIAADELVDGTLGTVKVQFVKIMDGTLDSSTKAAVGAAGLKVDGSGATQPVSGSLTTVSTVTSLTQMNGAAISMGTGVRGAGVQRVTISTDDVVPASQSGTWTVQPGNTANTTPWLSKLSDGTNAVAVKASSTAPAATDPALVVSISPNSVNSNGAATAANSAPVVMANDTGLLAVAHTAAPTAKTDGQAVPFIADKVGKLIAVGSIRDLKGNQFTTITSSTAETTVVTAVASTFLDVYGCIIENTSGTACKVTFKDSTAGTTQFEIYVPAGDTRGFMMPEGGAFKQTTVNTNWTATCSTSVASIVISMLYVKNI